MSCTKQKHLTKAHATRHAVALERKEGTEKRAFNVYLCMKCGRWHVGHKTIRERLAQAKRRAG